MNIDMNNLDEPRLTPPEVVYERKASLKKTAVIPLYAKIASAAAAVALVLTLSWPRPNRPAEELMAALKPLSAKWTVAGEGKIVADESKLIIDDGTLVALAEKHVAGAETLISADPTPAQKAGRPEKGQTGDPTRRSQEGQSNVVRQSNPATTLQTNRTELPLLAAMPVLDASSFGLTEAAGAYALSSSGEASVPVLLPQSSLAEMALAWTPEGTLVDELAESVWGRGVIKMTEGEYDGVVSILRQGWRSVKVEIAQLNETVGNGFRQLKQIPPPPSLPTGRSLRDRYQ